ncbi:MAG: transcription elongation factor GreB [Deltaproteobacteria bacterium HGW-Deltaproteobacteria-14]|jgi:transcription elongation factor GreB|nr:MAG: transcription elongation factor GreB [Deltaproteobacteria bacterium HGW-Deltaproteobacteria-14]
MAEFKNYITPRGFKRLRDEQRWLRLVERPKIVEEVAWAASLGDRSENAEYIYGKKRLREIDRRLRWLDKRISAAEVVDPATDRGDVVYFGATVILGYPDGSEKTLDLVGEDEIESDLGRISWRSPIGKALMRKREGEAIQLRHLGSQTDIEIVEVVYREQALDPPSRWDVARSEGHPGPRA